LCREGGRVGRLFLGTFSLVLPSACIGRAVINVGLFLRPRVLSRGLLSFTFAAGLFFWKHDPGEVAEVVGGEGLVDGASGRGHKCREKERRASWRGRFAEREAPLEERGQRELPQVSRGRSRAGSF
jgi:hypothetical protein